MRIFLCYVKIKDKAVLGGMELKRKIAVIATEYIKEFLQSMLGDLDFDYCIFTYKTFQIYSISMKRLRRSLTAS